MKSGLRSAGVYCGSSPGINPAFHLAARNVGQTLAESGIRLVYGGLRTGLMGALADAALEHGGTVTGVVPRFLMDKGLVHEGISELRIVSSMHERKCVMLDLSDATIILPGGIGTQDELWEVLAGAQLGFHRKPCGILNVEGYYNSLFAFIDQALAQGFLSAADRNTVQISDEPEPLIRTLSDKVASSVDGAEMAGSLI